jgi:hypothetical protein
MQHGRNVALVLNRVDTSFHTGVKQDKFDST